MKSHVGTKVNVNVNANVMVNLNANVNVGDRTVKSTPRPQPTILICAN